MKNLAFFSLQLKLLVYNKREIDFKEFALCANFSEKHLNYLSNNGII